MTSRQARHARISVPVMGLWMSNRIDHCIIDVSVTLIEFPKAKS